MAYGAILGQTNTTYTKDQILSSSDATLLGLSSTATPADMFNVLSHAGDLHVWRRTIITEDGIPEVPAGYTIGELQNRSKPLVNNLTSNVISYSTEISVASDGRVSLLNESSYSWDLQNPDDKTNVLLSKFLAVYSSGKEEIIFIPSSAEFSKVLSSDGSYNELHTSQYQTVTGYPYKPAVPPGTYIDYPVSTNRNAYQEGNDAKPAGYTLGNMKSETLVIDEYGLYYFFVKYSSSVSVSENGEVSLKNPIQSDNYNLKHNDFVSFCEKNLKGKFCEFFSYSGSGTIQGDIFLFPSTATFSQVGIEFPPYKLNVSAAQIVTGYAAIPAGTTIEYLGNLGDKARIVTGTYVGTGTYGSTNQTTISLPAKPKFLSIIGGYGSENAQTAVFFNYGVVGGEKCGFSYPYNYGPISLTGLPVTSDGQDFTWYAQSASSQMNQGGVSYSYIAVL